MYLSCVKRINFFFRPAILLHYYYYYCCYLCYYRHGCFIFICCKGGYISVTRWPNSVEWI